MVALLRLLPYIIKISGYRKPGISADRAESLNSFIYHCYNIADANKHFEDNSVKSKKFLQPIVVTVGPDPLNVQRAYVFIEGKNFFDFNTTPEAVHFAFICAYVLNLVIIILSKLNVVL